MQIHFAQRTLSLLQGSAKIGDSELHDINAKLDLGKHLGMFSDKVEHSGSLTIRQEDALAALK